MRRRRLASSPVFTDMPINALNTTPLIDVMLVLLVMFIITIPITTHKVPLKIGGGPAPAAEEIVTHQLEIDRLGRIILDGASVTEASLPPKLRAIKANPAAVLRLRVDGETRYEDFDRVLAVVAASGIKRLGMIDNARFAQAAR
jgi:biopolymer transport protein ExbD